MSDEAYSPDIHIISQEPIEAALKIESRLRSKWAIKITSKNEDGVDRCLGLDWDGVWHPIEHHNATMESKR